jgi:hypothetical protein
MRFPARPPGYAGSDPAARNVAELRVSLKDIHRFMQIVLHKMCANMQTARLRAAACQVCAWTANSVMCPRIAKPFYTFAFKSKIPGSQTLSGACYVMP